MACRDDTRLPDGLYGQGGRPQILKASLRVYFGWAHLPAISLSRRRPACQRLKSQTMADRWQAGVPIPTKNMYLTFFDRLER